MHRAGAVLLSLVLSQEQAVALSVACGCGEQAHYHSQRKRRVLTALGEAEVERAYYYCPQCHSGRCPRDRELNIEDTDYSPGVQRMLATVGSETSFDRGRLQLELLAGLTVTRKAVERHAEAIGEDIAKREQTQIQRALQLDPRLSLNRASRFYISRWMAPACLSSRPKRRAARARTANRPTVAR